MKKHLFYAIFISLAFLFLSCKKETINILLCEGTYSYVVKSDLEKFKKTYKCEVEVTEKSAEEIFECALKNAKSEESIYDVIMVDASWKQSFADNHVLSNLSTLGFKFDMDFIQNSTNISYIGHNIYLVPTFGNVTVLGFNKSIIKDFDIEPKKLTNLDDLLTQCKLIRAAGYNGFVYRGDTYSNIVSDFLPILLAHGTWVIDTLYNPTVNTNIFKKAVEYYKQLTDTGCPVGNSSKITESIYTGSAGFTIGWPDWFMQYSMSPADYVICPVQRTRDDFPIETSICKTWSFGIAEKSKHKAKSLDFIKFITNPEIQKKSVKKGGIPCRYSSLIDDENLQKYPHLETICTALEKGVYTPAIANWSEFTEILGFELENVLEDRKSIDEALAHAQDRLELLMNK